MKKVNFKMALGWLVIGGVAFSTRLLEKGTAENCSYLAVSIFL